MTFKGNLSRSLGAWWKDNHGEYARLKKPISGYATQADVDEATALKDKLAQEKENFEQYYRLMHDCRLTMNQIEELRQRNRVSAAGMKQSQRILRASGNHQIRQAHKLANTQIKASKEAQLFSEIQQQIEGAL